METQEKHSRDYLNEAEASPRDIVIERPGRASQQQAGASEAPRFRAVDLRRRRRRRPMPGSEEAQKRLRRGSKEAVGRGPGRLGDGLLREEGLGLEWLYGG